MNTQTSLVASQVRLQQWAEMIRDCQSRSEEMTVEEWCLNHGITKANYYYRLRRVRESLLETLPKQTSAFVELPLPSAGRYIDNKFSQIDTAAVLHGANGIVVEIKSNASLDFISALLGAMSYAK